ncbi:hypothetical protein [Streptomyces sp. GS7]|uniref:hypothetical protein n=1 Tax=Streptomyces sp. GS7 TaxID=2692234 RepID=UPI003FA72CD7
MLILGVSERAVMGHMGRSTTAVAARFPHMADSVRGEVARQVGGLVRKRGGGGPATYDDGAAGALVPAN